ncbi:MAG: NAD-dependent DNA ligase LigA, partial [Candidatus Omnitrophica bacterium]|nr:NAD-dependent DNA ligase LigA [Candidatus Omnitrophota bacterium]
GPVMAESIIDFFSQGPTKEVISELKKSGLNFKEVGFSTKKTSLSGKTIVFTGELKGYSRSDAEELVRKFAGNPSSSVSKNTDFVVAGENPGSKYEKAKKLGVKVIDEKEFSRLIT